MFYYFIDRYKLESAITLRGITFTTWMGFNIPPLIVNIIIAWLFLVFKYMGFKHLCKRYKTASAEKVREYLRDEYKKLGPISAHEKGVLVIFVFVVLLWLLRDPQLFPGWGDLIKSSTTGDSTPAMLGVILLFVLPKSWNFLKCGSMTKVLFLNESCNCLFCTSFYMLLYFIVEGKYVPEQKYEALLDWKFVSTNAPCK